jgi:hypothetical protein
MDILLLETKEKTCRPYGALFPLLISSTNILPRRGKRSSRWRRRRTAAKNFQQKEKLPTKRMIEAFFVSCKSKGLCD